MLGSENVKRALGRLETIQTGDDYRVIGFDEEEALREMDADEDSSEEIDKTLDDLDSA